LITAGSSCRALKFAALCPSPFALQQLLYFYHIKLNPKLTIGILVVTYLISYHKLTLLFFPSLHLPPLCWSLVIWKIPSRFVLETSSLLLYSIFFKCIWSHKYVVFLHIWNCRRCSILTKNWQACQFSLRIFLLVTLQILSINECIASKSQSIIEWTFSLLEGSVLHINLDFHFLFSFFSKEKSILSIFSGDNFLSLADSTALAYLYRTEWELWITNQNPHKLFQCIT